MTNNRRFSDRQTYRWTAATLAAIRSSMSDKQIDELLPTVLSDQIEAGGCHSLAILSGFDRMRRPASGDQSAMLQIERDKTYYLPLSHNFEKQQAVEHISPNYSIVPCVRPLKTHEYASGKHLQVFYEVEIEAQTESQEVVWALAESLLADVASSLDRAAELGDLVGFEQGRRNRHSVQRSSFPRVTFAEALERVGAPMNRRTDLTPDEDTTLCNQFKSPFWVYKYPIEVRETVFHQEGADHYESFDLMLPFGYGELATGGVRPKSGQQILDQSLHVIKEAPETLTTGHADWKSSRKVQSTGLGLGLERMMRFMSGSRTVNDFIQPHDWGPNRMLLGAD